MSNVVGRLGELERNIQRTAPYEKPVTQAIIIGKKAVQYLWDVCELVEASKQLPETHEIRVAMAEDLRQLAEELESPIMQIRWEEF